MATRDLSFGRLPVLQAMLALCRARLLVDFVPFERWRASLGPAAGLVRSRGSDDPVSHGRTLAAIVELAALRLPFRTKCLPRAMALSWMLRRRGIAHGLVFAVRPAGSRGVAHGLHAWVEIDHERILGDLSGPWLEILRLGD